MKPLQFDDIQGILRSAYSDLPCAAYLMCQIVDAGSARAFLQRIAPRIKDATGPDKVSSVNIAFTADGLRALGLDRETLATFSFAFTEGMTPEYRSRILGDFGENHPGNWTWGGPTTRPIHVLLMLFARDEVVLQSMVSQFQSDLFAGGLELVIQLDAGRQPDTREHFGFRDGIGQPVIEGSGNRDRQVKRTGHVTELKPGEFILGYVNEYDTVTEGPVVRNDPHQLLPRNEKGGGDLGLNGSYLVFRQMEQHVARFWTYVDSVSSKGDRRTDALSLEGLAAKFVGRWMSGAPLVLADKADNPDMGEANDFDYRQQDPHGLKCPLGAHIRRANPRNSLGADEAEALKSVRRHRLLRRGRSYGPRQADPMMDDGRKRGLLFLALTGDIERQFEFVQQTWINSPSFAGLNGEADPLIGNPPTGFSIQAEPVRRRCQNLSEFVTLRGGAYFFLPGLRALRYLASLGNVT